MSESRTAGRKFSIMRLLVTLAVVATVAGVAFLYGVNSVQPPTETETLKVYGMDSPVKNRLHALYTDADGDLVADPPKDKDQWIDPPKLTFCYLASDQQRYEAVWKDFLSYLGEQLDKEVEYVPVESVDEQLAALKAGRLHLTGVNTGAVPIAVNACGFVPVCGFGEDSKPITYRMLIIVGKESSISEVGQIAGRTLTLTNPTSNSGWKAPLTILKRDFKLLPVRDFAVIYSNGHAESLQGVASGAYEVAAVASDEADLAIDRGLVSNDDYQVIFESESFPHNILGQVHNLKPELSEKIKESALAFSWADSEFEKEFGAFGATEFVPVSYKNDLALIRQIDDAMGRRHVVNADGSADVVKNESASTQAQTP